MAEVFRQGGWRILKQPGIGHGKPDLLAEHAGKKYVIEITRSSEGRKDRLIPLMSQAILQAQEGLRHLPGRAVTVAIAVANYISGVRRRASEQFARRHAPDISIR